MYFFSSNKYVWGIFIPVHQERGNSHLHFFFLVQHYNCVGLVGHHRSLERSFWPMARSCPILPYERFICPGVFWLDVNCSVYY